MRLVVIWTMWPLPRFSISAIASCVMWKNPARLTPSTAAYSASLYCVKGFAMKTPALLMSVSIRLDERCADALRCAGDDGNFPFTAHARLLHPSESRNSGADALNMGLSVRMQQPAKIGFQLSVGAMSDRRLRPRRGQRPAGEAFTDEDRLFHLTAVVS